MEKGNINFVAIDFETMTPELTSACAVGMVQVVNGVIMQKFYVEGITGGAVKG